MVADDAEVADFAVEAPDDYLAMAVLERTLRWQYLEPECTANRVRSCGAGAVHIPDAEPALAGGRDRSLHGEPDGLRDP